MTVNGSPLLSIVVASYLFDYPNGAKNREWKFLRAIESALNQTFKDFEIIIVSDGCIRTKLLFDKHYSSHGFIKLIEIEKQTAYSSKVRNAGIENATGEYITYLDTDDMIGKHHLETIAENVSSYDWIWYDDYLMDNSFKHHYNKCFLKYGKCGTSNITHKRDIAVKWTRSGYSFDDWSFIQSLMKIPNHAKVTTPEYFICHQPRRVDV